MNCWLETETIESASNGHGKIADSSYESPADNKPRTVVCYICGK